MTAFRVQAKRTTASGPPPDLDFGEVAYSDADQQLYVGRATVGTPPTMFGGNPPDYGTSIAALTATDTAHDTSIAALAATDAAHDTSIAALAATDTTHANLLSTLMAVDAAQAISIASFETSAQLNNRDTANRNRANHSGDQAIATVAGLQSALDLKAAIASIPPCLLGNPQFLPYPVTITDGFYTDPSGWLWYAPNGGSIGSVASGATVISAKLEALYLALWAHLGVPTGGWSIQTSAGGASTAGATAAADWAANKRLVVPDQRGRVIVAAGQGSGLTNRITGQGGGAETHALAAAENGPHNHTYVYRDLVAVSGLAGGSNWNTGSFNGATVNQGSGTPHNNMQPFSAYRMLWFTGERG